MTVSLSIITVCLNDKHGLERTAKSILKQTDRNFEWIVIDGNSTDGSVELLEQYSDAIGNCISEPDDGIYDAMNKGIKLASGRYCWFLNAGDTLYDLNVVEQLQPFLTSDLVIGQMEVFSPVDTHKNRIREYETQNIGKRYLYFRTLPHQATCIKRSLFMNFGLYDTSFVIAADHDFFARVFRQGASIGFAPFCLSIYMLDGLSTELKASQLFEKERIIIRNRHFSVLYGLWRKLIRSIESSLKFVVPMK